MDTQGKKAVYTVIDRFDGEAKKSFWIRIGVAFVNRDGSLSVKLDALPVNSALQIREWPAREELRNREPLATPSPASDAAHADIFAGA